MKLEPKQYWHNLKAGTEIIILNTLRYQFTKGGRWFNIDGENTEDTDIVDVGYTSATSETIEELTQRGFILGRHPDNIEQWQPKEGELVWVKSLNPFKGVLVHNKYNNKLEVCWFKTADEVSSFVPVKEEFKKLVEPYNNQDKPIIDFGKGEQWLTDGYSIVKNTGTFNSEVFYGHYLGQMYSGSIKFDIEKSWKLLDDNQVQLILEFRKLQGNE